MVPDIISVWDQINAMPMADGRTGRHWQ